MDRRLRAESWAGCVPTCLSLAESDLASSEEPPVLYRLVPRLGYLMALQDELEDIFRPFVVDGGPTQLWFEHSGVPLKWHLPVGVLFDGVCGCAEDELSVSDTSDLEERPWRLTVHFQSYPLGQLLDTRKLTTPLRWAFFNSLKEAHQLKFRSTKALNTLSMRDQNALWTSVQDHQADTFWEMRKAIGSEDVSEWNSFPIRLVILSESPHASTSTSSLSSPSASQQQLHVRFIPCPCPAESADEYTFGQLCKENLRPAVEAVRPSLFPPLGEFDSIGGETSEEETWRVGWCFTVQGLVPSEDTPVGWLCNHLCFADDFLYVVLRPVLSS